MDLVEQAKFHNPGQFGEYMVGQGQGAQGIIRGVGKAMQGSVQKAA